MKIEPKKLQFLFFLFLFWTLLGLSFGAISFSANSENDPEARAFPIYFTNLIKFYLWAALAPAIYVITKKFPFDSRETFFTSFAVHIVAAFLLSGIHSNIYSLVAWGFDISYYSLHPSAANLYQEHFFFGNFYLGILLYILIVIIIQAYLLFAKQQEELMRNIQMQAELSSAQLRALKMQLQPHFLFNALHSIASLNKIDPSKANKMIVRLGEFLRLTLESSEEQKVSLNEELNFLRYYLEIEQIRFSDRLTVKFDIAEETLNAEVPHLILQPLVENAFKHGIAPFGGEGTIEIISRTLKDKLFLRIKNSGAKVLSNISDDLTAKGTGLKNSHLRLKQIYGDNFRFELSGNKEGGMTAEIEIPFIVESDAVLLN